MIPQKLPLHTDHLNTGPVYVLGWSDGGIEALLLGTRHSAKVEKIAAVAANLNPTEEAFYSEVLALVETMVDAAAKEIQVNMREVKLKQMALEEPHIDLKALETIRRADAGFGGRPRYHPRRTYSRDFPPYSEQPTLHLP